MSSLQKTVLKSRLPPLPQMSRLEKPFFWLIISNSISYLKWLGFCYRVFGFNIECLIRRAAKRATMRKRDYTPVNWDQYFDKHLDVQVEGNTFRSYFLGNEGPVLVLLHGGGLSALGWSLFAVSIRSSLIC